MQDAIPQSRPSQGNAVGSKMFLTPFPHGVLYPADHLFSFLISGVASGPLIA
jgi:hypothetical protein